MNFDQRVLSTVHDCSDSQVFEKRKCNQVLNQPTADLMCVRAESHQSSKLQLIHKLFSTTGFSELKQIRKCLYRMFQKS